MTKRKDPKDFKKNGRPTIYTEDLADLICRRIATSTVGTTKLCVLHDDMPNETTIYEWRYDHPYFAQRYAQAKIKQSELMAEKLTDMAEEKSYYVDAEGNQRVDSGSIASQRLQVDTVKWIASKLMPKIYGDKQQNEVTIKHEDKITDLK